MRQRSHRTVLADAMMTFAHRVDIAGNSLHRVPLTGEGMMRVF